MDLYTFLLLLIVSLGGLLSFNLFLIFFGVRPQTKRLLEESKKLQLKVNQFKHELGEEPQQEYVSDALGGMGLEGVIASLIPAQYKAFTPVIVPIASGFIDSYLKDPKKLQDLASKLGVKIPDVSQKNNSGFISQM
jgi:hypothetical protein